MPRPLGGVVYWCHPSVGMWGFTFYNLTTPILILLRIWNQHGRIRSPDSCTQHSSYCPAS